MRPFLLDPRVDFGGAGPRPALFQTSPRPSLTLREGERGLPPLRVRGGQGELRGVVPPHDDHYLPLSSLPLNSLKLAALASILLTEPALLRESTGNPILRRIWRGMFGRDASLSHQAISQEQFERIRSQVLAGRTISQASASESLRLEDFGLSSSFIRTLDNPHIDREDLIRAGLEEVRYLGTTSSTPSESRRALKLFSVLERAIQDPNTLEGLIPETGPTWEGNKDSLS